MFHYKNLQTFLLETNGTEIFKKYRENPNLFEIKCAEYSPDFQMNLLNVSIETIKQSVLDLQIKINPRKRGLGIVLRI